MLSFELSEFNERLKKTKQSMQAKEIDVLLVSNPANMNYLSGYDGWSFYVPQLLVLLIDEDQPFWIGRAQDANGAKATTWLDENHVIPYPEDHIQTTERHPMDFVCSILKEIGQSKRTIGLEMDAYYFSAQSYVKLKEGLPDAAFKDATNLVNYVRIIKSDAEISFMKKAAKIVEKAMQKGIEQVAVGARQCDVAAAIVHQQIVGTEEYGGDYTAIVPLLPSGEHTSTPHLTWTDERYETNTPVLIEIAGAYKHYHSPMARTVYLGQPSKKMIDLSSACIEGINTTLAAIKPGMTGEEVEQVWRKVIHKYGFEKESRAGYSVGLNYPPDWGEHTASFRPGDQTLLKPNMTFHLMPGIWMDDVGFECTEAIRITENGCEPFADFPRKLFIKP
ncbi:ectoine hydrolase DoeA [Sporolactobacillus terrae]|uniref:Ectoine hydrolase DoeA n=1 Tax=Sporolactobacillus terrae TaxID=269673 RepID=A0A5K7WW70_9BACL|nr:ectoine hydrolase DoeA [Sporolactobacillus terrae]